MSVDLATVQSGLKTASAYGSALQTAMSLIPGFVTSAEGLLPAQGLGAQKLEMVKNWVTAALDWEGHALPIIESIWSLAEPVIATLVTIYTGNGTFAAILGATLPAPAPAAA